MILFKNVTKKYKRHTVLSDLSLEIPKGKTVVLIGPSGCGKTTTLKLINRLITPTSGKIYVNGTEISKQDVIALRRSMGFVIQNIGLFPHMTVRENIEIIAKAEKKPLDEVSRRTLELMEMTGLEAAMLDRYPDQLSGGQQQRVGVARAFALDPEIVLMDEPFSALDPMTRSSLQEELANIQEQLCKTIVFVTHDMAEAVRVGDLICIMQEGKVIQYDTPDAILRNPANDFVLEFIGKKRILSSPEGLSAGDIISDRMVTCSPARSLSRCLDKMEAENADTIFVVEKCCNKLLGVLTMEKIRGERDHTKTASAIMNADYVSATQDTSITHLAQDFEKHKLSCLPVVSDNGRILGVVTRNGILATLSHYYTETQEALNVIA